ncbi:MAG: hypothetical protein KA763_14290 [Xanthomonadales bacterium]|nr:hypothetical protein [Xanthomonadales bacterium]
MPTGKSGNVFDHEAIDGVIADVRSELLRAMNEFDAFNSNHEGYGVIREEFDELWDEIKKCNPHECSPAMRREAIQFAAMALRFLCDRCG